jgi:hypothetical protein
MLSAPLLRRLTNHSWTARVLGAILATSGATALAQMVLSLKWPFGKDPPLLHYAAFLMSSEGRIPYLDVFETSMPGTFFYHRAIGAVFGWSAEALRATDVTLLLFTCLLTWAVMRPFGAMAASCSSVLVALRYQQAGIRDALQRDQVGLILVLCAVAMAATRRPTQLLLRAGLAGIALGAASTIKPHLLIGAIPVLAKLVTDATRHSVSPTSERRSLRAAVLQTLPAFVAGCLMAPLVSLLYLWEVGALAAFWELVSEYLPLHLLLNGEHRAMSGMERLWYLLWGSTGFGGMRLFVPVTLVFAWSTLRLLPRGDDRRSVVWLLLGSGAAFAVYPILAGQFWSYHYWPLSYFVSALLGLALFTLGHPSASVARRLVVTAMLVSIVALRVRPAAETLRQLRGLAPNQESAADRMTAMLEQHVAAGDTVQPLDWTGGAVQALLRTRTSLATGFLYDYHFYHHVDRTIVRRLRERFLQQLSVRNPRWILDVKKKPRVSGPGTTEEFPALRSLLEERYRVVLDRPAFTLYEGTKSRPVQVQ